MIYDNFKNNYVLFSNVRLKVCGHSRKKHINCNHKYLIKPFNKKSLYGFRNIC